MIYKTMQAAVILNYENVNVRNIAKAGLKLGGDQAYCRSNT
jgi:hypothetical protein